MVLGCFFLMKTNVAEHDGGGDAAGLDGDYLVVADVVEAAAELAGHLVHQVGVKLVIEEAVHLEDPSGQGPAVLEYAVIEQFHVMRCE